MLSRRLILAPILLVAACGPQHTVTPPDGSATGTDPLPDVQPTASPTHVASASPAGTSTSDVGSPPLFSCRLPAPVKSEDTCKTDADCGVSDPCHARACVARSKSHPPDKSTICTQIMDCASADANPCVCFEGACALVPPTAAK